MNSRNKNKETMEPEQRKLSEDELFPLHMFMQRLDEWANGGKAPAEDERELVELFMKKAGIKERSAPLVFLFKGYLAGMDEGISLMEAMEEMAASKA